MNGHTDMERIMKLIPMDPRWTFPILFLSLLLSFALKLLLSTTKPRNLPPGPSSVAILGIVSRLSRNLFDMEPILRNLRAKYGPILTLRITSRPTIFIADRTLAHHALVHHGAAFAHRLPTTEFNVSLAPYGPLWRCLRRNLSSEILHPSRIKQFADARKWVLRILIDDLLRAKDDESSNGGVVVVIESFQFSMFCLLVLMCFGEKLDLNTIREIETVQKSLHTPFVLKLNVLAMFPKVITKMVFWKSWKMLLDIKRKQEEIFIPLIRSGGRSSLQGGVCSSYVDSLLEVSNPEEGGRRLTEGEIVSLCSEFLSAGTNTTATVLEWIMAELVKHQEIQEKLFEEIASVVPLDHDEEDIVKEEDLANMVYLKAVILEGLRRHPPTHFVVPHVVTEDVEIGGYVVPKGGSVNFMVAEMGWDGKAWDEPMEFRPERFLVGGAGEGVDITGSREIKMMPFGVGRRICPGLGLAMLHLEYFVANLVREFEWKAVEGEKVDMSEKLELTVVMRNHLRAKIVSREKKKMMCT